MAKIILDDSQLNSICENISHTIQADLLVAVIAELKKKKEDDIPKPEFLKKMILKKTDGNGNRKRS